MTMMYSFVSLAVSLAAIAGAWRLTKDALVRAEPLGSDPTD